MEGRRHRGLLGAARGAPTVNTGGNGQLRAGKTRKSTRKRAPLAQSGSAESAAASVLASLGSPLAKAASFAVRTDPDADVDPPARQSPRTRPPSTPKASEKPPTPSTLAILGLVAVSRENDAAPRAPAPATPTVGQGAYPADVRRRSSLPPARTPQSAWSRTGDATRTGASPVAASPQTPNAAPTTPRTPQALASPIAATPDRIERVQRVADQLDRLAAASLDRPPALCGCRECVTLVTESRSPYCSDKCQRREQNLRQGRVKCRIRDAETRAYVHAQLAARLAARPGSAT